ncbi:hypothetical protein DBR42_22290 [Pelomonas sp. HMWF004]|nr:hypothetical protein DBR42_22290 [Pelomonas sp. HMWF004]
MDPNQTKLKLVDHHLVMQADDCLQIRTETRSFVVKGVAARNIALKVIAILDGESTVAEIREKLTTFDKPEAARKILDALDQRKMLEFVEPVPAELAGYDAGKLESLAKHFKLTAAKRWDPILKMRASIILLHGSPEVVIPTALNLLACAAENLVIVSEPVSARDVARSRHLHAADIGRHPAHIVTEQLNGKLPANIKAISGTPQGLDEWRQLVRGCSLIISAASKPVVFNAEYRELNQAVLAENVYWMPLAVLDNRAIQIGPSLIPGETACYQCYEYRFRSNVRQLESYQAFTEAVNAVRELDDHGVLAPFAEIAANYAAVEAVRLLTPELRAATAGKVVDISLDDLTTETHPVLRVPRCPHCNAHADRCPEQVWA